MTGKIKNSLLAQMIAIVIIVVILILNAFGLTDYYFKKMMRRNVLQMNEQILEQIEDNAENFYDSMKHICTSLAYSPTVYEYFTQNPAQRLIQMDDMNAVCSHLMLLEDDILGIQLYDMQLNQIASIGEEPGNKRPQLSLEKELKFTGLFTRGTEEKQYYLICYPVYDLENPVYGVQIGMCELMMKTDRFADMLTGAQATENTQVYLLDNDDRIAASNVSVQIRYLIEKYWTSTDSYYVTNCPLVIEGWNIVSRIPQAELSRNNDSVKWLLIVTYGVAVAMIVMLVLFFYRRLIYPMQKIDSFIKGLVSEPEKRMKARRRDEIGTVITSLNQMMDDIQEENRKVQESQKKIYETEIAKKQLQALAYRNQINPHFLYNTFECIRAMALYYDVEDIAEITMALSNVFRFAVKAGNVVTVKDEVNYIQEYATIIDYRFMGKIAVDVEMEEEISEKKVIKLMLQPLVENAVFHGLEQKMGGGQVDVSIKMYDEHHIIFVVEDDGCGMEQETLERLLAGLGNQENTKGVGVANIYQRLCLFYGEDMTFRMESEPGEGTRITIVVPDEVKVGGNVNV